MHNASESLPTPFSSVLVANRGEIACRIIETLRQLGIRSIAVYSDADRDARHVQMADLAVRIGPPSAGESYLNVEAVVAAARESGADAVHPGYGFLSESTALAEACAAADLTFVGPSQNALAVMGDKIRSKRHVSAHGVPVTPGSEGTASGIALDDAGLRAAAASIGYPVLVKPSAGGGGKGMQAVFAEEDLAPALQAARRIARAAFGDDTLFIEKLIERPRHIEVQLLADRSGHTVHLGERECSLQRRHQKVIEEAPSPLLSAETRARIGEAACAVARSVAYEGAGTVEFLVSDAHPDEFFFMEMNTRLQVEHPVTEMVTGIDIVEWQLRIAAGQSLPWQQDDIVLNGHAIEARIYAEDPEQDFLPTTGQVLALSEPSGLGIRVDSSLREGLQISSHYDPMLAKVIAWAADRLASIERLDEALAETVILGAQSNIPFLRSLLGLRSVRSAALDTGLIARFLAGEIVEQNSGVAVPQVSSLHFAVAAIALDAQVTHRAQLDGEGGASALWRSSSGWRLGGPDAARAPRRQVLWSHAAADHRLDLSVHTETERGANHATLRVSVEESASSPLEPVLASVVHELRVLETLLPNEASAFLGGSGRVSIEVDGLSEPWHWAIDGSQLWVSGRGATLHCELYDRERQLVEQLRARAAEREAEAGDKQASPELLTPMPGTVVQLHIASGSIVARGDLVLTVEAMKMERAVTAPVSGVIQLHVVEGEAVARQQLVATIEPSESLAAELAAEGSTR